MFITQTMRFVPQRILRVLKQSINIVKEIIERPSLGRDGAKSRHIIEKLDDETISVTHQVEHNGEIIHQHQRHIGKYGSERQFPNEWVEHPDR